MKTLTVKEMQYVSGGGDVPAEKVGDKNSSEYEVGHDVGEAFVKACAAIGIVAMFVLSA